MKKNNLENDTMTESQLQKLYKNPIYPRDSKIHSDKVYVKIDDGRMGANYWCAFYVKNNKSFYFDSFGGAHDKFLLNQLPKPITYHKYKVQHINSRFYGSYCLYLFLFNWKNELLWYSFKNVFWLEKNSYKYNNNFSLIHIRINVNIRFCKFKYAVKCFW